VRIAKRGSYIAKITAELGPDLTVTKESRFLVK
jgi:hypothetical protein